MNVCGEKRAADRWIKGISIELYIYLIFFVTSNMTDWITVLAGGGNSEKYLLVLIIIYLDFRYVVWYAFKKLNAHAGKAKSFL